jgi:hypothetical protein
MPPILQHKLAVLLVDLMPNFVILQCSDHMLTHSNVLLVAAAGPVLLLHTFIHSCYTCTQGRKPIAAQLDADSALVFGSSAVPAPPEQPVGVDLSKARVLRLGRARPTGLDPSQIVYLDASLEGGALPWELLAGNKLQMLVDVSGNEVRAWKQTPPAFLHGVYNKFSTLNCDVAGTGTFNACQWLSLPFVQPQRLGRGWKAVSINLFCTGNALKS